MKDYYKRWQEDDSKREALAKWAREQAREHGKAKDGKRSRSDSDRNWIVI